MKECSLFIASSAAKRTQVTSSDVKKNIKYCKRQYISGANNKTYPF